MPLVERDAECAAVADAVAAASGGDGRLVFVEGVAGIGKTRLLFEAAALAEASGFEVLSATAAELESGFPFGVVRQLLERRLRSASDTERAVLSDGAAAPAMALLGSGMQLPLTDPGDPGVGMIHALYWLVANIAASRPVALFVDDLQWVDAPSERLLRYLVRRLDGLAVLIVVATRPTGGAHAISGPASLAPPDSVLRLAPLSDAGCSRVVHERLGPSGTDAFCAACREATGGNPFLLQELLRAYESSTIDLATPEADRIHALAVPNVRDTIALRMSGLVDGAVDLARAVAILADGATLSHAAALAGLDQAQAITAADALAGASILDVGEPLRFIHPLVRSAVYDDLPVNRRGALHQRAARLLADSGADLDAVASQLLASPPAANGWAVDALRAAAKLANARGVPSAAASYLRRGLAEPPDRERRGELLLELGGAEARTWHPDASEHLLEALQYTDDPVGRAHVALEVAFARFVVGDARGATEVLAAALDDIGTTDTELSLRLASELIIIADSDRGALYPMIAAHRPVLRSGASDRTTSGRYAMAALAFEMLAANEPAAAVAELALRSLAEPPTLAERRPSAPDWAISALIFSDRLEEAEEVIERMLSMAIAGGAPRVAVTAWGMRSAGAIRRGALAEAEVDARAVLDASLEHAWPFGFVMSVSWLLLILVDRGQPREALALLDQMGMDDAAVANFYMLCEGRGRARIAVGDTRAGVDDLLAGGRWLDAGEFSNPAHGPWRSHAALGLFALGDHDHARRLADAELELARAFGAPRALGIALRAHGLINGSDGLDSLRESVATLEPSPARLELARSLVEYGAALRRANQRAQSREPLRRGLDLAHRCGAESVVARARSELAATGSRPRRPIYSGVESLTVSELRVARMASDGLTNPQIAQALFVTRKTVEKHLANTYRKLDISGRGRLSATLASPDPDLAAR